jgi:hypothetical protein
MTVATGANSSTNSFMGTAHSRLPAPSVHGNL